MRNTKQKANVLCVVTAPVEMEEVVPKWIGWFVMKLPSWEVKAFE